MRLLKRRLALLGSGVILGLAALEILLRICVPPPALQESRGMYRSDSGLTFRMKPGFVYAGEPLNSRGFRGPEWAPRMSRRRIAAFGDSFMFGAGLSPYARTFAFQLQEEFARAGFSREVACFGTPSYSTVQSRNLYGAEREAAMKDLDPGIVLLGFYLGNDVHDNATGNSGVSVIDGNLATYRPSWIRRRIDPVMSASVLYVWCRVGWRNLRALWQRRPGREALYAAVENDAFAMLRPDLQDREPWKRGWSETERVLEEWSREVRSDSRAFVVVLFPDRLQVDSAAAAVVAARRAVTDYDVNLPNRRLAEICERLGIPCLDLTPSFAAHANPSSLYLPWDGHFSAEGAQWAARGTADFLERALDGGERGESLPTS